MKKCNAAPSQGRYTDSAGERGGIAILYLGFLFQTTPAGIVVEPQEVAVLIGHLSRDADLVAVEVVGLLAAFTVFGCQIADLRQGVVAVVL